MSPSADDPHLLLFDLSADLHLPAQLRFLVEAWIRRDSAGRLTIVTWHPFLREPMEAVRVAESAPRRNVQFVPLTPEEWKERMARDREETSLPILLHEWMRKGPDPKHTITYQWELFVRYAAALGATEAFIPHLDAYLPLFAAGVPLPIPVSGIFLSPQFYYRAEALNQTFALSRTLRNARLKHLFFFDPGAQEAVSRLAPAGKTSVLPDPVAFAPAGSTEAQALRQRLGIPPERKVFLLFGHLARRKGAQLVLKAIPHLAESMRGRIALVIAGVIDPPFRAELEAAIASLPSMQVVTRFGYIAEEEAPAYFGLADVVLTPYWGHIGSSGILMLACAAAKPVLSSDAGLVGKLTRDHRLGLTVDPTDTQAFALAITRFTAEPVESLCDHAAMRRLASENASSRFADQILGTLLG